MSIVSKVLTFFLGDKEERDLKEIEPYVGKIKSEQQLIPLCQMMPSANVLPH